MGHQPPQRAVLELLAGLLAGLLALLRLQVALLLLRSFFTPRRDWNQLEPQALSLLFFLLAGHPQLSVSEPSIGKLLGRVLYPNIQQLDLLFLG